VSTLADLPLVHRGKVRELYGTPGDRLLMVASDRVSTYDAVHPTNIPGKGAVLCGISAFWFDLLSDVVPNHAVSYVEGVPAEARGRGVLVERLAMLPVECVVRGYLAGSGWKDYGATGRVSGVALPAGLREGDELPEPIFTPSTKAEAGHDEAISFERAVELVGDRALAERVREVSLELYRRAAAHARERGVLLADTKFELGLDAEGVLTLGDEALTPDSSRYWPADGWAPGGAQPSFDKQYVRDWAKGSGWDGEPPAPPIPPDVVAGTQARYAEAYERLTGEPLSAWLERTGGAA
jgi:phosphoribosylaminoimidazole-succinocarboxamide synthase